MPIKTRSYTDADLPRLQSALARWIQQAGDCGYYHVGLIPHRIYEVFGSNHPLGELVHIWEEGAEVVGFTYSFMFEAAFFAFACPHYRGTDVELDMLHTASANTLRLIKESKRTDTAVITDVYNCDQTRMELLTQIGFVHDRLWDYINERSLSAPIPPPALPTGFAIRSATMDDYAQLASVRNHSFSSQWTPESYRDHVMRRPYYRPQNEIVAVAPDGRVAAFTVIWLDHVNKVGEFEPVGTHSDFRRLGLARAVMLHGLARMKQQGMARATVEHLADNAPARELYRSLGFQKKYETLGFKKAGE
ncbi:MAG: GNAT family N-acetyltransferase [Caldilineaceae bacterium]